MFEVQDKGFNEPEWTRGVYTVQLKEIEERESNDRTDDDGNPSKYRLWRFEVLRPKKFKGEEFGAFSSMAFSPQSKARQWVEAILNRDLEDGDKVALDELSGVPVHAQVGPNQAGKMAILSINPLPEDEEITPEEQTNAEIDELDSVPF